MAAYILKHHGRMTTMKLQKLCYYSQGWSLAWDGVPLFDDEIQAWANGPVVYALFKEHRGKFTVEDWPRGNVDHLTQDQRETIDAVIEAYGALTGQQLSDKTHRERPWREARGTTPVGEASQAVVDLDTMQEYFGGLDELS
ncbi:Panacea domain-containing protein [Actinomyces sp. Z5]|uniref:Panacea domain-containing protein n=1 Tax=Actinomyces sp. Z5 TaxID=2250216 RepID=UPI00215C769B|nr:type II toxin-antitoxin system antitoxin SocA domain-containing protein [Actinomyces sp. Z5]